MSRLLLLLIMIVCAQHLPAQNLIANGNFEHRNTCTEFHAICAPEAWFRVPLDAVSTNKGTAGYLVGNHHENMVMENLTRPGISRTYIYTRLLCPLEKGTEYVFSVSFKTPDNQSFGHVDLLWLDFEPFHFQDRISRAKEKGHITQENKTADQEAGWKAYSVQFTATGEEKYLLIGNMTKEIFPGKAQKQLIVYSIDNVKLSPLVPGKACAESGKNQEALYQFNYRHTPGKFVDELDEPPAEPEAVIPKDTVRAIAPPTVVEILPVVPPVLVNDTLVIPDVLFKFDKKELNPLFAGRLDSLIDKIKNKTFKRIEVLGHTDSLGNSSYNQRLSLSRAETVKKYLMDHLHYTADIIITKAFAAAIPVSTNATSVGRQKNRRVEIVLIK
jgi:outer membrane protein OmpA-like peptidoglycan-associated protein